MTPLCRTGWRLRLKDELRQTTAVLWLRGAKVPTRLTPWDH
jgi:hypothetical protein